MRRDEATGRGWRHRWLLLAILVLASGAHLGGAWWWQQRLPPGQSFVFGDSHSYWTLARRIAAGEPYQNESPDRQVFRTPGYPLLLAPIFWAGAEPNVLWGRWIGVACGVAAVAGVYALGRLLFDATVGLLAAAIIAVYPGAIAMSILVLSEAPFAPLIVASLWCGARAWLATPGRVGMGWAFAAGAISGLATLMRPSWLLFLPFATVVGIAWPGNRRRRLLGHAIAGLGLCMVMTPWWIRNVQVTGHFVLTTLEVGASLYDGIGPQANGASDMEFVMPFTAAAKERWLQQTGGQGNFEFWLDQDYRRAAIATAKDDPARVGRLAAVKFVRIWNIWPNEAGFRSLLMRTGVAVAYVPVLFAGLIGVWLFSRRGWPYVLLWLPAVYFTMLHMVFVGSLRYREPAMLTLSVLAAAACVQFARGRGWISNIASGAT